MQKNNTNIEELYKNSFKDYKLPPSKNVWKNINSSLSSQNRFFTKKKTLYFLSAIVIITFISILFVNNNNKLSSSITNQNYALIKDSHKRNITINKDEQNKIVIQQVQENISQEVSYTKKEDLMNINNYISDTIKTISNESNIENVIIEQETTQNNVSQNTMVIKNITLSTDNGCCPLRVEFLCNYQYDNIYWDFGNENTSKNENPVYTYQEPGTYIVSMEVFNNNISQKISDTIIVYPKPIANFDYQKNEASNNNLITFTNNSTNSQTYEWIFGDGSSSAQETASHNYETAGKYKLYLIAKSDKNCIDTASQEIIIKESKYKLLFPNAFNPDLNGSNGGYYSITKKTNTVFFPIINSPVQEYVLNIYNKKGTLLFRSNDINIGWDGYSRNALVPVGVYIYEVKGKFTQGTKFHQRGDVTVLYNTQR